MDTSFFRLTLGFLAIVAAALALVFVVGVVGRPTDNSATAPVSDEIGENHSDD